MAYSPRCLRTAAQPRADDQSSGRQARILNIETRHPSAQPGARTVNLPQRLSQDQGQSRLTIIADPAIRYILRDSEGGRSLDFAHTQSRLALRGYITRLELLNKNLTSWHMLPHKTSAQSCQHPKTTL
jgi:hypothetical protein